MFAKRCFLTLVGLALVLLLVLAACGKAAPTATPTTTPASAEKITPAGAPQMEGSRFAHIPDVAPAPGTEAQRQELSRRLEPLSLKGTSETPKLTPAARAGDVFASGQVRGRRSIFEFTNWDIASWYPDKVAFVCGQAALATVLTNYDSVTSAQIGGIQRRSSGNIKLVYDRYWPDSPWERIGTSPNRMQKALNGFGVNAGYNDGTQGEAALKRSVGDGYIPLVLLDVGAAAPYEPELRGLWGLHWVAVYAYDNDRIYLSNWPDGWASWRTFRIAWNTWLTQPPGMANRFILPWR